MFYTANFVAYNCSLCLNHDQSRISQCAQCAHSREAPTTLEAHHQENVKIVMLMFVTEVWLKCIETKTTEKGHKISR